MSLVTFQYDFEKDVDNFIRGTQSVNNKRPTKLQEEYETSFGKDFAKQNIESFLRERAGRLGIDFVGTAHELNTNWQKLEDRFVSKCEELFEIELEGTVTAFLSQNQRCTYRWRENYFFIYFESKGPNKTVMHELLHFYTHKKFESLQIDKEKFNEIKESLTVLLNVDFADLMGDMKDEGYPQHQEMRGKIAEMRQKGISVNGIFHTLADI